MKKGEGWLWVAFVFVMCSSFSAYGALRQISRVGSADGALDDPRYDDLFSSADNRAP